MTVLIAKPYQQRVLESVEMYFDACRSLGKPQLAFAQTTEKLWGRALAYAPVAGFASDMPYFCLRVPTGGGKTFLAAKSVQIVNRRLLQSEYSVVLWLVPSKAIREQTLKQLRDLRSPLHAALAEAGPVTVMDLAEARALTRATVESSTVVIVATVQAFRREDTEGLKVYESNGALMAHFDGLTDAQGSMLLRDEAGTAPYSLANLLRLRRPFLVVDEAHNNRTELSFTTFAAFNPSGIAEFTATPDTSRTPSNVLHSVSAVELKTAQMIKLPIILETQVDWQKCLAYAIDRRYALQAAADAEARTGAPALRPIVLIQAQPRNAQRDTLHVDCVRQELIDNHNVTAEQIIVATGDERGLEAIEKAYTGGISDPVCPVHYVLTQQALAEGWDCPSAYVLVSLAGTKAETAVEQLLGRILRQPGAVARKDASLNRSYAFVFSDDFTSAANQLRDRLVAGAGFERREVADFVSAAQPMQGALDINAHPGRVIVTPVVVNLSAAPRMRELPRPLRDKLAWDRATKTLTIRAPLSETEAAHVADTVDSPLAREAIAKAALRSRTDAVTFQLAPAERGERFNVPAMRVWVAGELQFFDDPEMLDERFELSDYDAHPTSEELHALGLGDRLESGGRIDVTDDGRVQVGFIADLERDIGAAYRPENWDEVRLAAWLCGNLPQAGITHASRWAFVLKWLQSLLAGDKFDLARANRQKFMLRALLDARLRAARLASMSRAYQATLFGPDARQRVEVTDAFAVPFDPHGYAPNRDYDGRFGHYDFQGHYYGRVGDFDSREEFECACWLDQQVARKRMDFWVRNLVRKEGSSFFLQKADGRFYPDFLCSLIDGAVLAVEYKGGQGWTDAKDDREIGKLWETLSNGRCQFAMVRDRQWGDIDAMLPSTASAASARAR